MPGFLSSLSEHVRRPGLLILAFHRMVDDASGRTEGLRVRHLALIASFLKARYRLLTLGEAVDALACGAPAFRRRRLAVLTFDDGFRDFVDLAFPVLTRLGAPATLFVTTGCTGTGRLPWFCKLDHLLKEAGAQRCAALVADAAPAFDPASPRTPSALRTFMRKRLGVDEREDILDRLWRKLALSDEGALARSLFPTWSEITEMARAGIELGAHTIHHPDLSTLDDAGLENEIVGSKAEIEDRTGSTVATFAYPWGDEASVTPAAFEVLRRAGFSAAVTSVWGVNYSLESRYALKRKGRRFSSRLSLWLEVSGWLDVARAMTGRS